MLEFISLYKQVIYEIKLKRLKIQHKAAMEDYSQQVRDFVDKYGPKPCDYLNYRRDMSNYHRGAYNALVELEKED